MNGRKRKNGVFIDIVLDWAWIVLGTVLILVNGFNSNVILGRQQMERNTIRNSFVNGIYTFFCLWCMLNLLIRLFCYYSLSHHTFSENYSYFTDYTQLILIFTNKPTHLQIYHKLVHVILVHIWEYIHDMYVPQF